MSDSEFETRKKDHIEIALSPQSQALSRSEFDQITLPHDSLPEINLSEVSLSTTLFSQARATPFFIAGMTAGHQDAEQINLRLAEVSEKRGWIMGVGSQRRELALNYIDPSIQNLKKNFPSLFVVSNLGISQLIELHQNNNFDFLHEVIGRTKASAMAIHLNPLQECIQTEGTPNFRGSLEAIEALSLELTIPLILKETGSGMSENFLRKIAHLKKLAAVDVSGCGGTHWGRVEGLRAAQGSIPQQLGETFQDWGVSTVQSIINAKAILPKNISVWASGGVRSGLDAAKCLALGANAAGFARPALEHALQSTAALDRWMAGVEAELKVAMFCSNRKAIEGWKLS